MDAGPLSRNERIAFWACAAFAAVMRWPARSLTLWDWDEALFALALRDFDVSAYHPHPPGFPLFIAAAKLVPLDGFHALQTIVFLSSLFVFPAMFFLARSLRASAPVAIGAGLLLAFFPNVWFFGGTALSDVPSMVLVVTACALLLRGNVVLGAIVLGIAAGFRPQNLLIGLVPFAISVGRASARPPGGVGGLKPALRLAAAAIVLAAIVVTTYGTAAALSGGWSAYREVLAGHETYIRTTDSFLAPRHPGLIQVADDFFFRPYRAMPINAIVTILAATAVVRRKHWLAIAIFGPFCFFAWLFLDFHSTSRFSIAYMPMFAMLAAAGIPRRGYAAVLAAVTALMIGWTWPALRVVHTTPSPPVAAIEAVRNARGNLYVDHRLGAHADLLLPERLRIIVRVAPPFIEDRDAILLKEELSAAPGARNFTRERERLEGIARKRYFETSVIVGRRPTA
ncbi:MAG TPA: hypothetical protein VEO54_31945 [Thermoanaerobaculia bacterium]|nr:hypothetical protein [Thermoanaerobaculia bacterium]